MNTITHHSDTRSVHTDSGVSVLSSDAKFIAKCRSNGICSKCARKPIAKTSTWYCTECLSKKSAQQRRKHQVNKLQIFTRYGGAICVCCGETKMQFLSLDHINDNGSSHRAEVGEGSSMYRWVINNNFPTGFQVLCHNCNHGRFINKGTCPHIEESLENYDDC